MEIFDDKYVSITVWKNLWNLDVALFGRTVLRYSNEVEDNIVCIREDFSVIKYDKNTEETKVIAQLHPLEILHIDADKYIQHGEVAVNFDGKVYHLLDEGWCV
jgi:hypothetical protein